MLKPSDLHIIVTHFNPSRAHSHKRLRLEFLARYADCGAQIYVGELALGDRAFEVIDPANPRHIGLRAADEVPWPKENLANIVRRKLVPADAKYIALIDGDVTFMNPDFVMATLHELQHAPVIQMFSETVDAGPSSQAVPHERGPQDFVRHSFGKVHVQKKRIWTPGGAYDGEHCGYAWAFRNDLLNELDPVNPLVDYSLVGSADWIMACCFVGAVKKAVHGEASASYLRRIEVFAHKCARLVRNDLSYIPGLLIHHWHGAKKNRGYMSRWGIVIGDYTGGQKYDPDLDVKYRADGLLVFTGHNPRLPLLLRDHGRGRNEDSIDTN